MTAATLPPRWYPLRDHDGQGRLRESDARFDVVEAGRRSGKTEFVKRQGVIEAVAMGAVHGDWVTKFCAPTREQAKTIFWKDLKDLSAPWHARAPQETELCIFLRGGAEIWVCGLDKPQRIEGSPMSRLVVDELADIKPDAWDKHLRPALDTEWPGRAPARAWLIGVPRPGGQFAKLARLAQDPAEPDFAYFHWTAATVLSPEKIESARRTMDPQTFEQEYEARRVDFQGLAYYQWSIDDHYRTLEYDPRLDLHVCFDFNVEPGIAAILQEQTLEGETEPRTCCIGEVHIPRNSNTPAVCRRIIADWGHHEGRVFYYGDASGGARHSSQENQATDWDLVRQVLKPCFGDRLGDRVGRHNPAVRDRVNAVNSRLKSTAGNVRLAVDPQKAPNVIRDFEGVTLLAGGSGEIDKKGCEAQGLTHLSDAIGYYIHERYPVQERETAVYY